MFSKTRYKLIKNLAFLVLTSMILSGCIDLGTIPEDPQDSSASVVVPQLSATSSILIQDRWDGLDDATPIEAVYVLQRRGAEFEGFEGTASFSVGGDLEGPFTSTEQVMIPGEAAKKFLEELSNLPAALGDYPTPVCCDNYPFASIEVHLDAEVVTFSSNSPLPSPTEKDPRRWDEIPRWYLVLEGGSRLPWVVTMKGETYIINSDRPAEALTALNLYLKKDILARLIDAYQTK